VNVQVVDIHVNERSSKKLCKNVALAAKLTKIYFEFLSYTKIIFTANNKNLNHFYLQILKQIFIFNTVKVVGSYAARQEHT